jgi:hypothetical protein
LKLTIEQSVSINLGLFRDMAPQMEKREEAFRRDRESYLTDFQARLRRLNDFRHQEDENLSEPGKERCSSLARIDRRRH